MKEFSPSDQVEESIRHFSIHCALAALLPMVRHDRELSKKCEALYMCNIYDSQQLLAFYLPAIVGAAIDEATKQGVDLVLSGQNDVSRW